MIFRTTQRQLCRQLRNYSSAPSPTTPKPSAYTVNIQLPPTTVPWASFDGEPRVKPTASHFTPRNDEAYQNWTEEMDAHLTKMMTESPDGYLEDFESIKQSATDLFAGKSPRDIRLRWQTFLKPQRYTRDKSTSEIRQMKKLHGDAVRIVNGRWCFVPQGRPSPLPGDKKVIYSTNHMRMQSVGLSSLEIHVQMLKEQEQARSYLYHSNHQLRKEKQAMKREGTLLMEEIEWTRVEDLVLREAFEEFGDDWERISRSLRVRKRLPEECRERMVHLTAICHQL